MATFRREAGRHPDGFALLSPEIPRAFVQREPWLTRDNAMIDMLKSIGIEQGEPFAPDAKTQEILNKAAREAHAWFDIKYEAAFLPPFNEGSHWAVAASPEVVGGMSTDFAKPGSYPTDGRGVLYSMAYFSPEHLGAGQFYLMTINDKDGQPLDGPSVQIHSYDSLVVGGPMPPPTNSATPAKAGAHRENGSRPPPGRRWRETQH
jgi:hypothetical protein